MKTPRFAGRFRWSALRQQLLSLREDVESISKIAGRNVTIDEHRGKGKVINVASRRPTGGGGTCIHQISFDVKFDQEEIDYDGSVIFDFHDIEMYVDHFGWSLSVPFPGMEFFIISGTLPWAADTWYSVTLTFTASDTELTGRFCVNGICVEDTSTTGSVFGYSTLTMGDQGTFHDVVHRSYRNINATSGIPGESTFSFPTDSFDSLVGGASVTTEGGDTVLRLDDEVNPVYGRVTFGDPWLLTCPGACCYDDACAFSPRWTCAAGEGIYQGNGIPCDPNPCPSGACCSGVAYEFCSVRGPISCATIGGAYKGDGTVCDPDPCGGEFHYEGCCLDEYAHDADGNFGYCCIYVDGCPIPQSFCGEDGVCGEGESCVQFHLQGCYLQPFVLCESQGQCGVVNPNTRCVHDCWPDCYNMTIGECCYQVQEIIYCPE